MDEHCYERSAHTSDGFTHGYYWQTGKLEIHTDNLVPQGFELNMNHQHHHHHPLGYDSGADPKGSDYWGRPSDYHAGATRFADLRLPLEDVTQNLVFRSLQCVYCGDDIVYPQDT